MTWIALALIIGGLTLCVWAVRADRTSSFEDGSVIVQSLAFIGGVILALTGVGWLAGLLFAAG